MSKKELTDKQVLALKVVFVLILLGTLADLVAIFIALLRLQ